jgi:hypothetical protein
VRTKVKTLTYAVDLIRRSVFSRLEIAPEVVIPLTLASPGKAGASPPGSSSPSSSPWASSPWGPPWCSFPAPTECPSEEVHPPSARNSELIPSNA